MYLSFELDQKDPPLAYVLATSQTTSTLLSGCAMALWRQTEYRSPPLTESGKECCFCRNIVHQDMQLQSPCMTLVRRSDIDSACAGPRYERGRVLRYLSFPMLPWSSKSPEQLMSRDNRTPMANILSLGIFSVRTALTFSVIS